MKKPFLFLLLLGILFSCAPKEQRIKITFTGDVILDRGVADELRLHGDSLLLRSFAGLPHSDFKVINLEGTLTRSEHPQSDAFNFRSAPDRAALLEKAGVTHVSIANNHIFDFGSKGYQNTIEALSAQGLTTLGNSDRPVVIKKGKVQCAVLSASLTTYNDSLPISSIQSLKASVKNFEQQQPNIPLVLYLHWGLELQPVPEKWQQELACQLIALGADAIIGHHPHVTQTIEFIHGKPVFYSLGNFIADGYLPRTDVSYTVELEIQTGIEQIRVIPLQVKRYFPCRPDEKRQFITIKQQLKQSDQICAYRQSGAWMLKPSSRVDFSEPAGIWVIAEGKTISTLRKINPLSHILTVEQDGIVSNRINLLGQLSEFQVADIDNNKVPDFLIGIAKKVKFDTTLQKRINIYSLHKGMLQPLWLGTKFISPIESFDVLNVNNFNYLTTVEMEADGRWVKRTYEWDHFGFALTTIK